MTQRCSQCGGPITRPGRDSHFCCYGCQVLAESPGEARTRFSLGLRLGVGMLVIGQSMIFGLALNLHDDVPATVRWYAQSAILAATILVLGLLGGPLFSAAWRELRRGRITIEALFLLTMAGAMGASLQAHITGRGAVYFEVVSVLLVVYTLGKAIGAHRRSAALAAARGWSDRLATCRRVESDGRTRIVPVAEIRAGDCIEVNPGESIAVDGLIREGTGYVNEAAVRGEPFAMVRRPGDPVLAGSATCDSRFRIVATTAGTQRQIDRLLAVVEAAREVPTSMQARADALGRVFLPLVVTVAIGTFIFWSAFTTHGWEAGLFHAMSVLLVACPCVIGLATPIILWTTLNRLAERGVLVRSGDAIERLATVNHVVFDKTGTLTEERHTLIDIETTATGPNRSRVLGWLAAVEQRSSHPVAKAFATLPPADVIVRSVRDVPGCGVVAEVDADGLHEVRIGRPGWVTNHPGPDRKGALARIDFAIDGEYAGTAWLAERLRDSIPETLAELHRMNLPVELLTGDSTERAGLTGIAAIRANLLPDDKRQHIEALRARGQRPLMVGDGINDASALASAHVGVALATGTDLAMGAADVTLTHGDLRVLPWAIVQSRAAVQAVRRNLFRALAYNLIGMALAAGGVLHPIAAALLMVVSSLSLVFSATRVGACHGEARATNIIDVFAALHGIAVALQGIVFAELLGISWLLGVPFAIVGMLLALVWRRWATIPHTLDMVLGMLTLGNLGMLLGWWADLGFAPAHCLHCCSCTDPLAKPGMWLGMLLFANVAMFALGRSSFPRSHGMAMLTGGNVGMLAGMFAGGAMVAEGEWGSLATQLVLHFVGMTLGMLAGMLMGTWLLEPFMSTPRPRARISRQPAMPS